MKQFPLWFKIAMFFLAVLLIFAAERLPLPALTPLGWVVFGVLALLVGLEVIVTQETSFFRLWDDYVVGSEVYSGCAAQLWGLMFVLFGLGLALGALAALVRPQQAQAVLDQALEEPWGWGILIGGLGVFVTLYSLARLLAGGAATVYGFWQRVRHVGYQVLGGVYLLISAGLVALGLMLISSPEILNAFIHQWAPLLPHALGR
jgi:hypothetical protein